MNLFQTGNFILASGKESTFKIECDALTMEDWETLARLVANNFTFSKVIGIPRGGLLFADALEKYESDSGPRLIVDDVYTTGKSITPFMTDKTDIGVVVFSRNKNLPENIKALFQINI